MAWSKIPLFTFYSYFERKGDDLFEALRNVVAAIPDNDTIDADLLISNILNEAGEFPVLYADPEFFKNAVNTWALKQSWAWNKYVKALQTEYSPLENYDRLEEWQDDNVHEDEATASQTNSQNSHSTSTGENTDLVSAFNVTGFQNADRSETGAVGDIESTGQAENRTQADGSFQNKHTGRVHGNIGVTTSQQMLLSELELANWNVYDIITTSFISELCLALYV